jgi:hypothetical protein
MKKERLIEASLKLSQEYARFSALGNACDKSSLGVLQNAPDLRGLPTMRR